MRTIAITIDEDIIERMDQLSSRIGPGRTNRSSIIRQAVREYLSRIECETEQERETEIFKAHRKKLALQTAALVKEQART